MRVSWIFCIFVETPRKSSLVTKIGVINLKNMRKIQKTSQLSPTFPFSEYDFYKNSEIGFRQSELGGLYQASPFKAMASQLGMKTGT